MPFKEFDLNNVRRAPYTTPIYEAIDIESYEGPSEALPVPEMPQAPRMKRWHRVLLALAVTLLWLVLAHYFDTIKWIGLGVVGFWIFAFGTHPVYAVWETGRDILDGPDD